MLLISLAFLATGAFLMLLIGERTRALLPEGATVEAVRDVRVKGKEAPLDAFLLQAPA